MNVVRDYAALLFVVLIIFFFWNMTINYLNPLLRANMDTLDDTVALYVDTLHMVDEGRVEIDLPAKEIGSVRISYETKGKKDGYEINSDGWHAVVSYRFGEHTTKTASRINTYPEGADIGRSVFSPEKICIVKSPSSEYARLEKC
jgi:hypothetical protein